MLIPIKSTVYLLGCADSIGETVRNAVRYLGSGADCVEISIAEKPKHEMRGSCMVLSGNFDPREVGNWTSDTEIILIMDQPDRNLLSKGFVDVLGAEYEPDRLEASVRNMIMLNLRRKRVEIRENMLNTYFEISDDMLWTKDMNDHHMDINHILIELAGKPREAIEGKHEIEIYGLDPNDEGCGESDRYVRTTGNTNFFEESMPGADGKQHHLHVTKAPWIDGQGKVIGTIGLAKDVTDLMNQQTKFDKFLNSLDMAIVILDNDRTIQQSNNVFRRITERPEIGPSVRNAVELEQACFREAADLESNDYVLNAPGEGESIWNKGEFVLYDYWGKQSGYINVYQDVTYEREQSRRIKKMAVRDPLTGLANRAGMYEYFDTIDKSKRVSFMYMDVDDFKQVNDRYGHGVGDRFLTDLAGIFRETLNGAFAARMGGDEFFIIIEDGSMDDKLTNVSEILQDRIRNLEGYPEGALDTASLSIGVVKDIVIQDNVDEIIDLCDAAMYSAKKSGKGRHVLLDEV